MSAPERIGRYLILDELGQGAMGTVYRARDESLDREVAVKVMSRGLAEADGRTRFQREARAAARLQHPNIVVVYELGEHQGAPYMVLELLDGVDLQHAIESGIKPDPRFTLPIVLQLLAGLGHAHEHGIVHRDVKPSNVFLPLARPAKIMDFGVARLAGLGTTTAGTVVGTPNYMSPEQASGGEVDGRSDLFSTGLILYELVTGEKAIRADTIVAVIYKIMNETPDLSQLPEGARWARLRAVLERALARQPAQRYADARAMAADLSQALVDLGGTVDPTAPADQILLVRPKLGGTRAPTPAASAPAPRAARPQPTGPAPRREERPTAPPAPTLGRPLLVGAATVALLGAAVGGWLLFGPGAGRRDGTGPSPAVEAPVSPTLPAAPTDRPTDLPRSRLAGTPLVPPGTPASTPSPAPPGTPTPTPATAAAAATPPTPAPGLDADARLARARDAVTRGRWSEALAEARAVLDRQPTNTEATALAQRAEEEVVIEECLKNARAAIAAGDRERALEELRRGSLIRKNDPRLLEVFREAAQQ